MSGLIWGLEWRIALRRRRLFLLNVVVPLFLVLPIAWAGAPPVHAAAVYSVLFVLHATFGSAIPLVRDGEAGRLTRVTRAGISPVGLLLERAAAGACLDGIQLAPSLGVIVWAAGASADRALDAALATVGALWIANLVGALLAAAARSLAEAALFSAVGALLLLHASGVFRTGVPGSLSGMLERVAPFRALHESMLALFGAAAPGGMGPMAAWAILLPGLVGVLSAALLRGFPDVEGAR